MAARSSALTRIWGSLRENRLSCSSRRPGPSGDCGTAWHDEGMGATPLVVTGAAELEMQLKHPTAEIIRARANEVFGNVLKAQTWLGRSRKIFGGRSPEQIMADGDAQGMRQVLEALIAIEFGTFS